MFSIKIYFSEIFVDKSLTVNFCLNNERNFLYPQYKNIYSTASSILRYYYQILLQLINSCKMLKLIINKRFCLYDRKQHLFFSLYSTTFYKKVERSYVLFNSYISLNYCIVGLIFLFSQILFLHLYF